MWKTPGHLCCPLTSLLRHPRAPNKCHSVSSALREAFRRVSWCTVSQIRRRQSYLGTTGRWAGAVGQHAGPLAPRSAATLDARGKGDVSGSDLHKKLPRLLQQLRRCTVAAERAGRGRSRGILPQGLPGTSALQPSTASSPFTHSSPPQPPSPKLFEPRPGNSLLFCNNNNNKRNE